MIYIYMIYVYRYVCKNRNMYVYTNVCIKQIYVYIAWILQGYEICAPEPQKNSSGGLNIWHPSRYIDK